MSSGVFKRIIDDGLATLDTTSVTPRQWQVLHHLQRCRTSMMGSYRWHCGHCDQNTQWYCSCRDRHCPVCQGKARDEWVKAREKDVLPVAYHHVVFTLPHQFNSWATVHPSVLYTGLFNAVWETLSAFANKRHHLAGKLGMMCVLHTWGQTLSRHIHLHCLIPAGVLAANNQWQGARNDHYLFPVKALSVKYRGKMLAYLREQADEGELGQLTHDDIGKTLKEAAQLPWIVYSKPVISHADTVVKYLARYCNRVGVSESRLSLNDEGVVELNYLNNRTAQRQVMTCSSAELLRRFLLHVLPKGFMRLRYYGFMANCVRRRSLNLIRTSLSVTAPLKKPDSKVDSEGPVCPHCQLAGMTLISVCLPARIGRHQRTI